LTSETLVLRDYILFSFFGVPLAACRFAGVKQEVVMMEPAAFFAVAKFRGVPLAQLLYAGDDVSGEFWSA